MMGQQQNGQARLFYALDLDAHVPQNHLLRGIERFLDLGELRRQLAPFYSHTGRPSIDPELMIRMLLVGYCVGIRSERRLFEEVHLNLAYRWFCRLGLEDSVPDHSTFTKNRHGRFREGDAFRQVFETVLSRCMREGLVGGEGFAIDASVVKADASRERSVAGADYPFAPLESTQASRATREYLDGLEQVARGRAEIDRKRISLTDPAAEWTCAPGGPAFFAYSTNYLVDVKAGVIVDVEATSSHRVQEVDATRTMIDRVEARFGLKPKHLIGDMAYGAAPMLGWLVDEKHIAPHIPLWEKSLRSDGTFSRPDFVFDPLHNRYTCRAGKFLNPTWRTRKKNPFNYRASLRDCGPCPLKAQCCPKVPHRKITRSPHEPARDVARQLAETPQYKQSRKDRKKVEMLFAHLKSILKLRRLRLRGPTGANDEFLLAATVQNLRRMAKRLWSTPPEPCVMAT